MRPARSTAGGSADEGRPARTSPDRRIEAAFREGYVHETYLSDGRTTIASADGVVTLSGRVAERLHRTLAEEAARALPGVSRVENELETDEEVAAENPDTWLGRKVMLALRLLRQVNARQIVVEVKDGIVTLKGETPSTKEKNLITDYARHVDGVREVVNAMTVASVSSNPAPSTQRQIDDASITAQVNTALRVHRATRNTYIKAVTRDGIVSLTGIAGSDRERKLAGVLAGDIRGVLSVTNNMTVDPAGAGN